MHPDFAETKVLHLAQVLPAALLERCRERLGAGVWAPDSETGSDFVFDTASVDLPELDAFLAADHLEVRALCGLSAEVAYEGRLKRLSAGSRFPWHRDHRHGRLVGMSVNLSATRVQGGLFEQRLRWETEAAVVIRSEPGDVHLFDVSDPRLVHRVTAVTAGQRVVHAGWWSLRG